MMAQLQQPPPMGSQNSRVIPQGENKNASSSFSSCCVSWAFNLSSNKNTNSSVPRPTQEEVKQWETDFDGLLKHGYGVRTFHDFLKTQHSQENLNFWMAVERYKLIKTEEEKGNEARRIYENYISILSPTEISIDSKTRSAVEMNMDEPSDETFQPAQEQIYILMKRDCLPRFLKSKHYRQLVTCN